jgi:hypothetical protein
MKALEIRVEDKVYVREGAAPSAVKSPIQLWFSDFSRSFSSEELTWVPSMARAPSVFVSQDFIKAHGS